MKKLHNPFKYLNKFEWCLWVSSLAAILVSFFAVKNDDYATLATSLIGVTSLIFAAKGDFFAPLLMIAFSVIYALVSFGFGYYGETVIYSCMQLPTCVLSLISWLKNPAKEGGEEVKVGKITKKPLIFLVVLAVVITTAFFFILRAFNTKNLIVSTISVATSFIALYLMILRVPAYAAAFMLNDIVLVCLWSFACAENINYLPMVVCFSIFLINDLYTFICWTKRRKTQSAEPVITDGRANEDEAEEII